ncbi:LD-carboxypeptidase [Candidatus Bathycorpusculum sp.]|uniref:S66 peptidase family protein n=1 Tax=Candidatus Bathycorpusculum sp. TaxID=2994959 RepID=UPI00283205EE|nr:LD-carboxypeptidase [Candidatus Termitimicrobium sp.]
MNIIKPHKLEQGDTIGLVSPSEPVFFPDKYLGGIEILKEMGFKVKMGSSVLKQVGYMAGNDKERADDINTMFRDPDVDAIITTTGGSCANRILPYLDYDVIRDHPKIFLGISDITPLLLAIYTKTGLVTFHGPCLLYGINDMSPYNKEYFIKALMSTDPIGVVREVAPRKVLKSGNASGKLIGGNMSAMRTLIGTPYEPNWEKCIFFWEEFTTEPHVIDRLLMHYRLTETISKVSGMISGNLSACVEKKYENVHPNLERIVVDHCKDEKFPVMFNLDFGHNCENVVIPIGCHGTIDANKNVFSIDETGVS